MANRSESVVLPQFLTHMARSTEFMVRFHCTALTESLFLDMHMHIALSISLSKTPCRYITFMICTIFMSDFNHYFTLCMLGNFHVFSRLLPFLKKINFLKKFFQEHHLSVKWFGLRSGPTFCQS